MSKKLIKLFSILTLFVCIVHSTSVFAANMQPTKALENTILLNFLSPYITKAFNEKNITPSTIDTHGTSILSIHPLPNDKFEVEVFVKTYTGNHVAPFGSNIVTLVIDSNNNVEVINIVEREKLTNP